MSTVNPASQKRCPTPQVTAADAAPAAQGLTSAFARHPGCGAMSPDSVPGKWRTYPG
ncbi:MAG: hypothetical protein ACI39C_00300 [Dietzia sp.]